MAGDQQASRTAKCPLTWTAKGTEDLACYAAARNPIAGDMGDAV